MNKLLLLVTLISSSCFGYSQCQPVDNFGNQVYGISPDTIENFNVGYLNQLYHQQVDVKIPSTAAFAGFPFISISYGKLEHLNGLPPGLTYQCAQTASQACSYVPGVGCMVVSGTPTQTGVFPLDVKLKIYSTSGQAYNVNLDGYFIEIQGAVGVNNPNIAALKIENPIPNPAHLHTSFKIESKQNGRAELYIFDLVGKKIYERKHQIQPGVNQLKFTTAQLPEGVYIYRIDAFTHSVTGRLYVVH